MAKRKPAPDPRQLDFFSMPAPIVPVPASVLGFHCPGSAEEAEAIAAIPFGRRWENFVAVGAVPEQIDVPLPRKNRVALQLTDTRLGWTSGYHLSFRRPVGPGSERGVGSLGGGGGGYLHCNVDEHAFYLWTLREAALRSAAYSAWWACWELDAKVAADVERALEKIIGGSPTQAPGDDAKRRLVSRADGYASLERRRSQPHEDVPESPAIDEYRRAAGLSDVSSWRAAA